MSVRSQHRPYGGHAAAGRPCGRPPSPGAQAHPLAGRLAAPSFVLPGGVAENARFLAGRVDEVGLCLFETQACLDYGPQDLPADLAALPLRWHAHLPVDLPWPARAGASAHPARRAARAALAVLAKVAFLRPRLAVLHPPEASPAVQRRLLTGFIHHWRKASAVALLLENVAHSSVACLGRDFAEEAGVGFCLDVGHLLGYKQGDLLASALPQRASLFHWSAPGGGDRHLPLNALTPEERRMGASLLARAAPGAVHMAEVFHWPGAAATLASLARLSNLQP